MAPYITLAALALAGSASARLSAAPAEPARALLAEQGGRCSDRDHPVAMSLSEEDLCLLHPGETVESCAGLDREGHANYCASFDEAAHLISLGQCFSPDAHGDLRININDNGDIECGGILGFLVVFVSDSDLGTSSENLVKKDWNRYGWNWKKNVPWRYTAGASALASALFSAQNAQSSMNQGDYDGGSNSNSNALG